MNSSRSQPVLASNGHQDSAATAMVERVAMALFARDVAILARRREPAGTWEENAERQPEYRAGARAAIEAMREPSGWMVTAGSNAEIDTWNGRGKTFADDPSPIYRAMIDAALAEPLSEAAQVVS